MKNLRMGGIMSAGFLFLLVGGHLHGEEPGAAQSPSGTYSPKSKALEDVSSLFKGHWSVQRGPGAAGMGGRADAPAEKSMYSGAGQAQGDFERMITRMENMTKFRNYFPTAPFDFEPIIGKGDPRIWFHLALPSRLPFSMLSSTIHVELLNGDVRLESTLFKKEVLKKWSFSSTIKYDGRLDLSRNTEVRFGIERSL